MIVGELDVALADGASLHAYDSGGDDRLAVVWHHGTPNVGAPPVPLFDVADRLGLRWVSYDRPGYGGSTPAPGRTIGDAARWATALLDALGIDRCAVLGHSGGGSHALAAAALLGPRCVAAISAAGLAPFGVAGLDWYAGMAPSGEASLRAAAGGRAAKEAHEATAGDGGDAFTDTDMAALQGEWGWLGSVVRPALAAGPGPLIDDDLAYVAPWGCDPAAIAVPVLLLHGARDAVVPADHGRWLAAAIPGAELRVSPDDGHLSVLRGAPDALAWLRAMVPEVRPGW